MIERNENRQSLVIFSFDASVKAFAARCNPNSSAAKDLRTGYELTLARVLQWPELPSDRRLDGKWEGESEVSYVLTLSEFERARRIDGLFASLMAAESCVMHLFGIDTHGRYAVRFVSYRDDAKGQGRAVGESGLIFGATSEAIALRECAWSRNGQGVYFVAKPLSWWRGLSEAASGALWHNDAKGRADHGERIRARQAANGPWGA